jgi:hypothetical protein
VVPLVIAIAAIYLVFEGRREKSSEVAHTATPAKTEAMVSNSGNSTASGGTVSDSGNSKVDVHVYPTTPPVRPEPPRFTAPAPREKRSCMEIRDTEIRPVYLDDETIWRIGKNPASRGEVDSVALLLPIYFNAKESDPGARVEYAKVHLVFTNPAFPRKPITVAHACWVGARFDSIEINPGETKNSILAFFDKQGGGVHKLTTLSTNRTKYDWYEEADGADFDSSGLPLAEYQLEIVLIWGGGGQFREIFNIPVNFLSDEISKQLSEFS